MFKYIIMIILLPLTVIAQQVKPYQIPDSRVADLAYQYKQSWNRVSFDLAFDEMVLRNLAREKYRQDTWYSRVTLGMTQYEVAASIATPPQYNKWTTMSSITWSYSNYHTDYKIIQFNRQYKVISIK